MKKFFYGLGVYTLCVEIYRTLHYGPTVAKEWSKAIRECKKIINDENYEEEEREIKNKRNSSDNRIKPMNKIGF